jgi:hypothetical protein
MDLNSINKLVSFLESISSDLENREEKPPKSLRVLIVYCKRYLLKNNFDFKRFHQYFRNFRKDLVHLINDGYIYFKTESEHMHFLRSLDVLKEGTDYYLGVLAYNTRKAMIKIPDSEIVIRAASGSENFKNESAPILIGGIVNNQDFFRERLDGKKLFSLGAGEYGHSYHFQLLFGWERSDGYSVSNLIPSEIIAVDLFANPDFMARDLHSLIKLDSKSVPNLNQDEVESIANQKLKFEQIDMLQFLLNQPTESGNIMVAGIDMAVIHVKNYHERVAQEAFRVTPYEGVLICCYAPSIEWEAKQIFPYFTEISNGSFVFFSKTELPPSVVFKGRAYALYKYLQNSANIGILTITLEFKNLVHGLPEDVDFEDFLQSCGFEVEELSKDTRINLGMIPASIFGKKTRITRI